MNTNRKNNNSMISVIVPVYNSSSYFAHCIMSIALQDYKSIEVIVIDDGSDDGFNEQFLIPYQAFIKQLRYRKISHSGLGRARNIGIMMASGEYIVFVDSDDTIHPRFLTTLLAGLDKADMSICGINKINVFGEIISEIEMPRGVISNKEAQELLLQKKYDFSSVCNKIYKTSIIKNNYIRFIEGVSYEDILFNMRYLQKISNCYLISERLYNYSKHYGSITMRPTARKIIDYYVIAKCVSCYCEERMPLTVFNDNVARKMEELLSQIEGILNRETGDLLMNLIESLRLGGVKTL